MSKSLRIPASANHIITGVNKGIDVIIVLQLPSESEFMRKIDEVLQRICSQLKNEQTALELNLDDENILGQITDTVVYSNIPSLMALFTVRDKKKKPSTKPTKSKTPTLTTPDSRINILLLGETGVGKSTFINAFVNYLKFKTFEDAQSSIHVVLIPVSFLITVGNNFEERVVKFGDYDTSNNEDFEHPGESVTQHCRTYEFHLPDNDGQKLCIIDTPGFDDTRG
ncbi:unnamed protein product [Rotaria magnacalcarata]